MTDVEWRWYRELLRDKNANEGDKFLSRQEYIEIAVFCV